MGYTMDSLEDGCYEGTTVLVNKFDIREGKKLDIVEQGITSALITKAMLEIPFKNVDFEFYKMLHQFVFSDIYDWAGNVRNVNISKKGTNFCPYEEIEENATRIFNRLIKSKFFVGFPFDEFIDEFTDIYCELNYLHPFREGNGRIQRLFMSMLVESYGKKIDFSKMDKDLFMIATIKSVSGDVFLLKNIFRESIL